LLKFNKSVFQQVSFSSPGRLDEIEARVCDLECRIYKTDKLSLWTMIYTFDDFVQPLLMPNAGTYERVCRFQLGHMGFRPGEHQVHLVGDVCLQATCWFALIANLFTFP
jgi:hypothetical protein